MKRREAPAEVDPIMVAAATPDEPFDGDDMMVLDGVVARSWEHMAEMQEARRRQLSAGPPG